MSDSFRYHGLQHTRLLWPSLSPRVCSSSCPLNRWCYSTISSSAVLFSFCLQSSPASGSFPIIWLFTSGSQSIGALPSASVLPMSIRGWFPLGLTGSISLLLKEISAETTLLLLLLLSHFSHVWLCNSTDRSTPGCPVLHYLPEFAQVHVHWVGDAIQPSHPWSPPSPCAFTFPSIRVFSNESVLHIRWPKYWSFSFSISPSNEYLGLISFRIDWFDLLEVQGTLTSLLQHFFP